MEHPYELSDTERTEYDWQREQQAQSRFLRETYCDEPTWLQVHVCENCGEAQGRLHELAGWSFCDTCMEDAVKIEHRIPRKPPVWVQLDLFGEVA